MISGDAKSCIIFGFVTGELSMESTTLLEKVQERNLWQSRLIKQLVSSFCH